MKLSSITQLVVLTALVTAPMAAHAAVWPLNATMNSREQAKLAAEIDELFRREGPEGVLRNLRARGCRCYDIVMPPGQESNNYTRYLRCDKSGWYWLAPIVEWIIIEYGPADHEVSVNADYDVP